jgi:purine-binding chemotaxis protein CheW
MSAMSETDRGAVRPWDELARSAAERRHGAADAEALRQLLGLVVDGSPYAVPVENVREIVRIRPITPIPRVSSHVRGVISLRGEIVQVIDLRRRLGLAPIETTKATRIVVVHTEDGRVAGVLVDAVREVMRVSEDAIRPSVATDSRGCVEALCTRGDEFVSLLDLGRLLDIDGDA